MKKIAVLAVVTGALLTSCKKSYTCDCTVTQTVSVTDSTGKHTYTALYKNTSSKYSAKLQKAQAQSACDHEELAVQSNFNVLLTNNGTQPAPANTTLTTNCTIHQ